MSYSVKPGNIFGRIGTALGQGLAESIPKETERARLSQGLQDIQQQGGTPFQQYSKLLTLPGMTPQGLQGASDLLRQEGHANALIRQRAEDNVPQPSPFPQQIENESPSKIPSITTSQPIQETLENYIPKTEDEIIQDAGIRYNKNPALYGNDPQKAIEASRSAENQRKLRNEAYQQRRINQTQVQNTVTDKLQSHAAQLEALNVPANVYSDVEDEAIKAVLPKDQGGRGLTEQQAMKEYGKKLDSIARDYKALDTIGDMSLITRTPSGNKAALRSIRNKFKERNDLENLADSYISKNGLSPMKAYYLAYPISDVKELNNEISKIPDLQPFDFAKGGIPVSDSVKQNKTLKLSEKLASNLGKTGSPLAVAQELQSRGYDAQTWLDYVDKNRNKLDLTERQARELDKPRDFTPTINDLWLFLFSGLDKIVEQ